MENLVSRSFPSALCPFPFALSPLLSKQTVTVAFLKEYSGLVEQVLLTAGITTRVAQTRSAL